MFIVNVQAAIFDDGKWLIIERSLKEEHAGGLLSLVGGKVELEGNSTDILERTVKREVLEEVGITVSEHLKYVQSTSFVTDKGEPVVDVVFLCKHESGKAFAKSQDEVSSVQWMSTTEIMDHPNSPPYLIESIKRADSLMVSMEGE